MRLGAVVNLRMRDLTDISVRFVGSCGRANAAKSLYTLMNLNIAFEFAIALTPSLSFDSASTAGFSPLPQRSWFTPLWIVAWVTSRSSAILVSVQTGPGSYCSSSKPCAWV